MAPRPVHVGKFFPPPHAGVEAHVDTLLRSMIGRAEPTLVAGLTPGRSLAGEALPYRAVPVPAFGRIASVTVSPGVVGAVQAQLRSGRANLLHIHAPNPWGDWAALAVAPTVPVVLSWHSDIVRQKKLLALYRGVQRRVLRRVDRIIVFTPMHYSSSEQLHQLDVADKVEIVPMGIDTSRFDVVARAPLPETLERFVAGKTLVLTIGRHVYYKGYEQLIDAFASVDPKAALVMVGAGPLTTALQQRIDANGLGARVRLVGEVGDATLISLLHRCDVFTLPSIEPSEAFGIAAAEAMACGKPTVVCELGNGVNFLNQAGRTSLVVPPRDVPALSAAIDRLVSDQSLRRELGERGRRRIRDEFSLEIMAERTLRIYESLLHQRGSARSSASRPALADTP